MKNGHLNQSLEEKRLDNGLIMIEEGKCRIKLNNPTHIGTKVLESSQVLMHHFHFNYIKNKCYNKAMLLFTDTSS